MIIKSWKLRKGAPWTWNSEKGTPLPWRWHLWAQRKTPWAWNSGQRRGTARPLSLRWRVHWKRPQCWGRLMAGGEGGDGGWDGWMASLTQWMWVWANSGRYWRTRKPGMLQSTGSQSQTRVSKWTTTTKSSLSTPCFPWWNVTRCVEGRGWALLFLSPLQPHLPQALGRRDSKPLASCSWITSWTWVHASLRPQPSACLGQTFRDSTYWTEGERFQRPRAAILNVVVRRTSPGAVGSMWESAYEWSWVWKGFSGASDLLPKGDITLLTARTTIDARQGPRVSWSGNMAFHCWAGFLQPSEGRRATGSSRGRLWEYGPVTGSSQDRRGKGGASQHPKAAHHSLQRTRDKLVKEPYDGSTERSSTGVPPPSFSAPAASIKLCVLFIWAGNQWLSVVGHEIHLTWLTASLHLSPRCRDMFSPATQGPKEACLIAGGTVTRAAGLPGKGSACWAAQTSCPRRAGRLGYPGSEPHRRSHTA